MELSLGKYFTSSLVDELKIKDGWEVNSWYIKRRVVWETTGFSCFLPDFSHRYMYGGTMMKGQRCYPKKHRKSKAFKKVFYICRPSVFLPCNLGKYGAILVDIRRHFNVDTTLYQLWKDVVCLHRFRVSTAETFSDATF